MSPARDTARLDPAGRTAMNAVTAAATGNTPRAVVAALATLPGLIAASWAVAMQRMHGMDLTS